MHWLADTRPADLSALFDGLSQGEPMWTAWQRAFPDLTEKEIAPAMGAYLLHPEKMKLERFPLQPWTGAVASRRMTAPEMHALRAQLFDGLGPLSAPEAARQTVTEAAQSLAIDPGNPLALALTKGDAQKAVDLHPDDWRSWELWSEQHDGDLKAIRKAAELQPRNASVLAQLALAEQSAGLGAEAVGHAEQAIAISRRPQNLGALAVVYAKNQRCAEARTQAERALDALPDAVPAFVTEKLRGLLDLIVKDCALEPPVAEKPALKTCAQRLDLGGAGRLAGASAKFSLREDGTVTSVSVEGVPNEWRNGQIRRYLESCRFEAAGTPRREVSAQLDKIIPPDPFAIEPVLKKCRKREVGFRSFLAQVRFTIQEDGSVAGVVVENAVDDYDANDIAAYLSTCQFEPVIINGEVKRAHLDMPFLNLFR